MTKAEKEKIVKMLIAQKHSNKANGLENVNLGLDQAITLINGLEAETESEKNPSKSKKKAEEKGE